jgi:hypothetical protein
MKFVFFRLTDCKRIYFEKRLILESNFKIDIKVEDDRLSQIFIDKVKIFSKDEESKDDLILEDTNNLLKKFGELILNVNIFWFKFEIKCFVDWNGSNDD